MRAFRTLTSMLFICIFALALIGCSEKVGTAPDGNEAAIEEAAILVATEYAQSSYKLADMKQMKNWIDLGEIMTIVDIRPASDFAKGHLPEAVNAEISRDGESTDEQLIAFLDLLPDNPDSYIVVYDDYTLLNGSHRAALYATEAGYTNVYRLVGGAIGWEAAGNSLTKKK